MVTTKCLACRTLCNRGQRRMKTHIVQLVILVLSFQYSAARAQSAGSQIPAPELLKDVRTRPAMQLSQFEQFALIANPTLQQANALVRGSAGRRQQAGLLPNPSVGYQGEEIRGGSFGGGEQGGFIQQTFVLGGKLGLRRN